MNTELIDGLARAADSSKNIPHLRRLVVALAISGKLDVSNDEEPFTRIVEHLKAERVRLIEMGKLKRQDELPSVSYEELPMEVARACHFERLGNLATLAKGLTGIQSAAPGPFPLVVTAEERTSCDHFDFDGAAAIVPMVSSAGHGKASIKRLHYQEGKFALGNILCAVFPISEEIISARFLYEYLTTFKEELLVTRMIGTANVSLTIGKIADVPVPLVSRSIQQRVDELMALCDRLEVAQAERESRRDRLAAASLHRLNNGADADAFREHAHFYFNHLPHLTTRHEHIKQLRQTILNLAVRGKLVSPNPNDEAVFELLKRIGAKASDDVPFPIPDSWAWVPVGRIGDSRLGKMLDKAKNKGTLRRYLRNINVRWFDFNLSDVFEMPFEDDELDEFALHAGDVLICEGGEPGRAAVWDKREEDIYFQKAIHRVRFAEGVDPHFFVNTLRESADSGRLAAYFTGVGIKHFTGKGLASFVFPLPPLAEQHRIVAKVDELMALCNQLEAQLTTTHTESRRFLEAVLHEALTPALEKIA